MMKNRDWHKDFSEIPGLQKAGHRHRDSGVASPRFKAFIVINRIINIWRVQ